MSNEPIMQVNGQPYRLTPYQWPQTDKVITWSFADLIVPDDARQKFFGSTFNHDNSDGMRGLVRDAFATWENICGVDFVEVADSGQSNIRIGWMHPSDSDGFGGLLGVSHTYSVAGTTTSNAIVVDHADSGTSLASIYDTILHEVGHSLGLAHSDVANVVMSGGLLSGQGPTRYWEGVPGRDPLQPDDIAGAVSIWGLPGSGPTPPPQTPPTRPGATSGNDTLFGTMGPDRIDGQGGNDIIYGERGNDTLIGGSGNDDIVGGLDDTNGERNVLIGGTGNDHLTAGYTSGAGSDRFVFGPGHGRDTVYGNWGSAADHFGAPEKIDLRGFGDNAPSWAEVQTHLSEVSAPSSFGNYAPSVRLDLTDFGGGTITFWNTRLQDIDASDFVGLTQESSPVPPPQTNGQLINGTSGPDSLTGTNYADAILGGAGNDLIRGGSGDDRIWGQDGDDTLYGERGNDLIFGLAGNDSIDAGNGRDIVLAGTGNDLIIGGEGDDGIWAEAGNDTLEGGAGADFLAGGSGNDQISGGRGSDYLAGEGGNDTLNGGAGYDVLAGGDGADLLEGGAEGDTFFGQGGADLFVLVGGTNWIMDWQAEVDRIQAPGLDEGSATQLGHHLRLEFDGGEVFFANTTISNVGEFLI